MNSAGKFTEWLKGRKDASVSFVLEKALRQRLEKYGQVLEVHLDSGKLSARLELLMKGESQPVALFVDKYDIRSGVDGTWVTVVEARASREWLTLLLQDFLLGKAFRVPEQYSNWVKMLL